MKPNELAALLFEFLSDAVDRGVINVDVSRVDTQVYVGDLYLEVMETEMYCSKAIAGRKARGKSGLPRATAWEAQ
jgi:hypothetical protein